MTARDFEIERLRKELTELQERFAAIQAIIRLNAVPHRVESCDVVAPLGHTEDRLDHRHD